MPGLAARLALVLALLLLPTLANADPFVWIEGEDATESSFNQHSWYSDVQLNLLSPGSPAEGGAGGAWLAHFRNDSEPVEARWSFELEEGGRHVLWLRCGAYRTALEVRVDEGEYKPVDLDNHHREVINLVRPKLDVRFLGWVKVGTFELDAGAHSVEVRLLPHPAWAEKPQIYGGVDAFCLSTDGTWAPSGALKPGNEPQPAPEAWFAYQPGDDAFSEASIIDLSHLLDRPAGGRGWLQPDGDSLSFADGTPARLFGLNVTPAGTAELQERQAHLYAKHGVRIVRQHTVQNLVGLARKAQDGTWSLDPAGLARLDRWFATLKEQGLYMAWSVFYPHVITEDDGYDPALFAELEDRRGHGKSTSGVVNFMTELQDSEWRYLKLLLEHTNSHTGLRYADDPALAMIEVHNEDCLFWHAPLNTLAKGEDMPLHTARLQEMWAGWLAGRYADDGALLAAWGPTGQGSRPGDSLSNEAMPIYGAWQFHADGPAQAKHEKRRAGDFMRFLAETQRSYYLKRRERIRSTGFGGLVVSTAWKAGGPSAHVANLWADSALDAIDRHRYHGGGEGGHGIAEGEVKNEAQVDAPGTGILSAALEQWEGKPFVMTEWSSRPPNQWKAETMPLMVFYGMGLHGMDMIFHFAATKPWMRGGWPGQHSYVSETPHYLGQLPALALAVHRGDIAEGDVVATRRLPLDKAFSGVDPLTEDPSLSFQGAESLDVPARVAAMGRVTLSAAGDASPAERADWSSFSDPETGAIRSTTDELLWFEDEGLVLVRAERTQGIIGRGAGRKLTLPAFEVELGRPFAVLIFSSLDDLPLIESSHILVTALARDRQTGARYSADGGRLTSVGGPPLLLEPVQARITYLGPAIVSAVTADFYGVPTGVAVEREGNSFTMDGRAQSFYLEIRTEAQPPQPPDQRPVTDSGTPGIAEPAPGADASDSTGEADRGPGAEPGSGMPVSAPDVAPPELETEEGSGSSGGCAPYPMPSWLGLVVLFALLALVRRRIQWR